MYFTVPQSEAPLAAQALQSLGYFTFRNNFKTEKFISRYNIQFQLIRSDTTEPTRGPLSSVRYNIHSSSPTTIVQPGDIAKLQTYILPNIPEGYYIQLTTSPLSYSTWNMQQDIIDASQQGPIIFNFHNTSFNTITIKKGKCIAHMIY